jgi:hypothetical protein
MTGNNTTLLFFVVLDDFSDFVVFVVVFAEKFAGEIANPKTPKDNHLCDSQLFFGHIIFFHKHIRLTPCRTGIFCVRTGRELFVFSDFRKDFFIGHDAV